MNSQITAYACEKILKLDNEACQKKSEKLPHGWLNNAQLNG